MSSMPLPVEDAIELYRNLCNQPFLSSAKISSKNSPGHVVVNSNWVQRDLETKEKINFQRSHVIQLDVCISTSPQKTSNVVWNVESPSGKYTAIVRTKKEKDEDLQFIEIWEERKQLKIIKVADIKQHGKIYPNDDQFGSFQWNRGETHLLYVAEKKQPKHKSFFDKVESETNDFNQFDRGEEYTVREAWGEQLKHCHQSVLCVLDIEAGAASVLENIDEDISPGQAVWSPDDLGVVCVGWKHQPYRLGLVYCPIRENSLLFIDLKTYSCSVLDANKAIRSPRFSPDGSKLVYLQCPAGGAHFRCSGLDMVDWATKGKVPVVEIVKQADGSEFPGIFTLSLPRRCWSSDSKRVVFSSKWRSKEEMVCVNVETGKVTRLTEDAAVTSWGTFDVHNDLILASCSSLNIEPYLAMAHLPEDGQEQAMKWTSLEADEVVKHNDINFRTMKIDVPADRKNDKFPQLDYECLFMYPSENKGSLPPLVVFPHGGPHSVFIAEYSRMTSFFCKCGYAVLLINYRGSVGFGQDSIDSLPGNIGDQDVKDCQAAVDTVLSMGLANRDQVVVCGGSHGGFLTAHLIGQYPDFYKAAVARNPVINIASMLNVTDIPDWCLFECYNEEFDLKKTSTADVYKTMWQKSPIQFVDQVKAPVLLMVGAEDLRVPTHQAREYMRALQSRGNTVKLISYPGNSHPIDKVESEADACINIIQWFNKYLLS